MKKYGFSQACSGCQAAQFGLRQGASREHTKECRARIETAIRSTGEDVRLLEDLDRRKAGICQDAHCETKHDAPDLRHYSVAEHPTPERDGGVADTLDTIGSDLDDNLQQHDNEHGRDDEVSVLESDQEVEGANGVRKFQSDEEALGGSKRRRLELLKTLNSTEIQNMVAHLDEKEIRVLKALHKAPVPKLTALPTPMLTQLRRILRPESPMLLREWVSKRGLHLTSLSFTITEKLGTYQTHRCRGRCWKSCEKRSHGSWLCRLCAHHCLGYNTGTMASAPCICSGVVLGTGRSW